MKHNDSEVEAALLQRVLAQSPVGRQELRDPQSGLSLPQRWLLGQLDGQSDLAALAARPGSPAAQRLPRDAAKLVHLGLAVDMGVAGPDMDSFGPTTVQGEITLELPLDGGAGPVPPRPAAPASATPGRSSRSPVLLAGASLLALLSAAAYFVAGAPSRPASAAAAAGPASTMADAALPATSAASLGVATAPGPAATPDPDPPPLLTVLPVTGGAPAPAAAPSAAAARVPALAAAAPRPGVASASVATTAAPAPLPATAALPVASAAAMAQPAAAAPVAQTSTASTTAEPAPAAPPPTAAPAQPAPQAGQLPPAPSLAAPAVAAVPVTALRPVSTVEPSFPRDGLGLGSRSVNLQARLTVDASGAVVAVTFVPSSAGTRSFERAARAALLQWRFPPGASDRVFTQQLRFSEE